ncbi:Embryonic polarity protein dorsal [Eumeta japonica]|uniref:Embryonic polarity protein dorsal n=1 Tax=Eumeta variegata TaxID=151549 RepID=A0A4C1WSA6_EUMVA|nr:Embryonic polarity protein dorsal [Eumeta japonica]
MLTAGFKHKKEPSSIDLNAVRLCFQVFLEQGGKIRHALPPVVSDIIYDKKAMSDLVICRLSHCSAPVTGGQQVILLCEKVTKEDIAVTFFEKVGEQVTWQADADNVNVHKQVAICFNTPRYHNDRVEHDVQAYIQLRRPSDNAVSESVPFEFIRASAAGRTARKRTADLSFLALLASDTSSKKDSILIDGNNNDAPPAAKVNEATVSSTSGDSCSVNASDESDSAHLASSLTNGGGELHPNCTNDANEKSLNELLDQVAELDEIYSENRTRLETATLTADRTDDPDDFDDAGTYTSLQLAFKNPVMIAEPEPEPEAFSYEDVQTFRGPIIEFSPLKRDTDDERAPPLPPKRVRKAPSVETFKTSQSSVAGVLKPGRQIPILRNDIALVPRQPSMARSEPALPPAPKKRSFLSRLFRRKEKTPAYTKDEEVKKEKRGKPVGRSVSSVSGRRPARFTSSVSHASLKDNSSGAGLSYADSITHISLHGDGESECAPRSVSQTSLRRPASLAPLPPTDTGTILVAESVLALDASSFKKLQDDLDLTDAEHYALYMALAPHATASEFDETSCYYSPVDGSKFQ